MKRRTFAQPQKNVPSIQKQLYNFIKKETLTQVFSCEFCEISKNTFLHRTQSKENTEKSEQSGKELTSWKRTQRGLEKSYKEPFFV